MSVENKVQIQINEEQKQIIDKALEQINEILRPALISLSPEKKKSMLIMGDKSFSFVNKALMFSRQKPEFVPAYLNKTEWEIDMKAWNDLSPYYAKVSELYSMLNDTIALCGNESFRQALTYYNTVKQASKDNVPGAKPIYEELKQQFPNTKKNKNETE